MFDSLGSVIFFVDLFNNFMKLLPLWTIRVIRNDEYVGLCW